ncbi:hypothetical protein HYDPIDRAFT_129558 [Hydnomerulius pinastri MD-312]|nr:hypothetical protein HYDPIDRAFT_129558 [Hydnomerulius pinastri MD-312]
MHSTAASSSCACTSSATAYSSPSESMVLSTNQHSCSSHSSSIPVSKRNGADDINIFVNGNAPQCCHCGWRGSHSPSCPFR